MNNFKNLPTKKGPGPYNFPVESYQALKGELILILQNSSRKIKMSEYFSIHLVVVVHSLRHV